MWTPTTRAQHSRENFRYQTDLTDAEWAVIAPHLPGEQATGRPRSWPMREIINGIFYVMRAGCACAHPHSGATAAARHWIGFAIAYILPKSEEKNMLRAGILWLLGVPLIIVILLWYFYF